MKKVIILNYGLHISGVSRALVNFANKLCEHGYDVTIKILLEDFTLAKEIDPRVKISLFIPELKIHGKRIKGFLRFYYYFKKWLVKLPAWLQYKIVVPKKYDIEIAFNRGAGAKIIAASRNKHSKKLIWVHNDYMKADNALAGFKNISDARIGYAAYDYVVCVSKSAGLAFRKRLGDNYNLVTRYNIIDTVRIRELAEEGTEQKTTNTTKLISVGRLCEQKNFALLLDAIALLNKRQVPVSLEIVGGGQKFHELQEQKEHLSLSNVVFLGEKDNPYPFIRSADIYISSSIYEGLGLSVIEALVLGKPVIATECTGIIDVIGRSDYGVLVPADANSLANAIENMIKNPEIQEHYHKRALQRAADFDPEKIFCSIEELLK